MTCQLTTGILKIKYLHDAQKRRKRTLFIITRKKVHPYEQIFTSTI